MRISEFILLDETQAKLTVISQGVFLAKRTEENYKVFLFQLEDYYVETFCNVESKNIDEYRVFQQTSCLTPYLDLISIDDMLN